MHGACGCISNAHQTNSLMCPSHRKSSEQLYVYVSLFIHINTYHIYIKITYNLDYISMPTFCCLKEKKSPLAVQPSMSQPRLRVPRRHAKVPPGRLSARHRASPANGSPGRTGFPKRDFIANKTCLWCMFLLMFLCSILIGGNSEEQMT